ncbi:ABC transporter substrate-binding protein [Pseudogracilibacillus sp. SO10305]|uniref:ABC transporter substrate-binding protein n=1 Tax=Pseudogracilibacillus sp. SO10305 TaxID=3098292 RepID=UPI00300E3298
MKKIMLCITALLLTTIFTACNTTTKQKEITLSEVTRSVFYAPQYAAIELGYFEEEGIDIELQTAWGGDKAMTALLSNKADIALVGAETSIYVKHQNPNDPIINFAQLTQTDGTFLVAKEPNDHFQWDDVKETNFLGQRVGGMPQMVGEYVLKQNGIDPHEDLELEQNIDFANIPSAFLTTDAQYVQLFEPTASTFEMEGKGHVVASFGEHSGKLPYTVFMTKTSTIKDDEEMIEQFTKAIYKAQEWIDKTDSEEIAKIIQPYFEDTELELLTASVERYKQQDSFATSPLLSEDGWNHLQTIMEEAGELPAHAPYNELVDTTIAKKVMQQ